MTKKERNILALVGLGMLGYIFLSKPAGAQPSSSSSAAGSTHAGLPDTYCGDPLNPMDFADYVLTGGAPCSQ